MQALREFAREYRGLVHSLRERHPQMHGALIDFDRRWLALWRLARMLPPEEWEDYDRLLAEALLTRRPRWRRWSFDLDWRPPWPFGEESPRLAGGSPDHLSDVTSFTCRAWEALVEKDERPTARLPIVMTLVRLPGTERPEIGDVADVGFRVRHLERPFAFAVSSRTSAVRPLVGGLSVGTDPHAETGTLGGILTDGTKRYALSCAHVLAPDGAVATQPSPADDGNRISRIGTVCARSSLVPKPLDGVELNAVDAALVELDGTSADLEVLDVGAVAAHGAPSPDEPVEVSGKHGLHQLVVGPHGSTYDIVIDGKRHTFDELIVLRRDDWGLDPVRDGDSGAWVIRDGHDDQYEPRKEWCGMVVGCDGPLAYAIPSTQVLDWLDEKGHALRLA